MYDSFRKGHIENVTLLRCVQLSCKPNRLTGIEWDQSMINRAPTHPNFFHFVFMTCAYFVRKNLIAHVY